MKIKSLLFFDFDGVIKESVEVKTRAFVQLFQGAGPELAQRVRAHHEANGGMSRFEKIPLYLQWAGQLATAKETAEYCRRFTKLTRQGVIDAPWVPGAEAFLRGNPYGQTFVLVTATPKEEIDTILATLALDSCFAQVHGAPTTKKEAIAEVLAARRLDPGRCLMIGDACADLDAASANGVPFLLRRHATNGGVFAQFTGDWIEDFCKV